MALSGAGDGLGGSWRCAFCAWYCCCCAGAINANIGCEGIFGIGMLLTLVLLPRYGTLDEEEVEWEWE